MIAALQFNFIGKAIRGPHDQPSRCMITACCDHQQQVGHPQTSTPRARPWCETCSSFLTVCPPPPSTATAHSRTGSMRPLMRSTGPHLSSAYSTLTPPSLSNRQHGGCHHVTAPELLPRLPRLPHPQTTGIMMTLTVNSPQHHCKYPPPPPRQSQQPNLTMQPPQSHLFLIQNNC
jgi:hypothetical protein